MVDDTAATGCAVSTFWSHMGAPSRRGGGENWGGRAPQQQPIGNSGSASVGNQPSLTWPHFLVIARPAGGPPVRRGGLRRTGFEGASAPALAYSAKSHGRREGWRIGGNVGCRVPVRG